MTTQYNTVNTYSPRGVNFPDGVRVGNFQLPGSQSTSRGISVVEPVVWSVQPLEKVSFFTQTFAAPGTYKLDLSNSSYYTDTAYIYAGNQLVLDCERIIKITTNQDCNVKVSALTQYNQKVVCEGSPTLVDTVLTFQCARGMRALTDVTVTTTVADTTINIETTNNLVLPFAIDFPAFLNARYIYSNGGALQYSTLFKCAQSAVAPYPLVNNYELTRHTTDETEMLPNSGTQRPILDLFNNTENYQTEFDGQGVLTIEFLVNSAGFNPISPAPYSNDSELTIGIDPYSAGWEG